MFCLQFSKEYLNYFFRGAGGGGGVEPLDPSPLIYALVYSAQKQYHATAVCKLRCIEIMFVIK